MTSSYSSNRSPATRSSHAAKRAWRSARCSLGSDPYAASRTRMWRNRKASSPVVPERSGRTSSLRTSVIKRVPSSFLRSGGDSSVTADRWKILPTTDARPIRSRSEGSRRSRRAATRAETVGGTLIRLRSCACQPPLTCCRTPSSTSMATSSSTKRGLPSAVPPIRS